MKYLKIFFILDICLSLCTACRESEEPCTSWQDSKLSQQLIGTSWQLYSIIDYWDDGTEISQSNRVRPQIYTFTNQLANITYATCKNPYILEMYNTESEETKQGTWFIIGSKWINGNISPSIQGEVVALTSDCLQLRFDYDDPIGCECDYSIEYYKRVYK